MELDEMKTTWMTNDRGLEQKLRINGPAARAAVHTDHALQRHSRYTTFELIANLLVLVVMGAFIGNHLDQPRFLAPALVLHVFTIGLTIACIRQLVQVRAIDYAEPVVSIQQRVERLRIEQIRTTKWTLIAAPLLWTPLLIVAMKGLLGLDAWALLNTRWLAANLLFGATFIPLMLWASRHFAARMEGSPLMQRLMDDLAGRSLQSARGFLDEVKRFEEGA